MRTFTLEELSYYDGKDGRPAYIAYKGKVYNVSKSFLWRGGRHQVTHFAGRDLTNALRLAPHGAGVFRRIPVVGRLAPSSAHEP